MELILEPRFDESFESNFDQDIKPMKGIEFDSEVQRFEKTLKLNGIDAFENIIPENFVSNFDSAFFEKVGEIKESIDTKLHEMHRIFNSADTLTASELIKAQYQVGMFVVEVTIISNGSDKVSDGITTLFQTK